MSRVTKGWNAGARTRSGDGLTATAVVRDMRHSTPSFAPMLFDKREMGEASYVSGMPARGSRTTTAVSVKRRAA